jgi:hypothetical protein
VSDPLPPPKVAASPLSRASVRRFIEGSDVVRIAEDADYEPRTPDRARLWSRIRSAATLGATYSALRALCRGNPEYVDFLIGTVQALRCEALEARLGLVPDVPSNEDLGLEPWDWEQDAPEDPDSREK